MNKKAKTNKSKEGKATSTVIISSLAFLVLGIIMVVWPDKVSDALCYTLGAALTIYGLFNIITFFDYKDMNLYFELIVGVLATAFGAFTLFSPQIIVKIIFTIIGVVIIIDSLMDIKHSFELKALGMKYWWVCLLVSTAVIILGASTIFFPSFFGDFIMVLLGIIMIYEGVSGLAMILMIGHYAKNLKSNSKMIDAQATDVD